MAAPIVAGVTEGALATAVTNVPITLPASGSASDLYLVIIAKGSVANTVNALTDWTEILDENAATGFFIAYYSGTGVPSNPTFVQSAASRSAWGAYRITGAQKTGIQVGTTATGSSTTPNPPSVSVTGGPKDVLAIAVLSRGGEEADDDTWLTGIPSGFSGPDIEKAAGTVGTNLAGIIGAASNGITNTSTVDPLTFTIATGAWRAQTIVVHPVPPTATSVAEISLDTPANTPPVNTDHTIYIRARMSSGTGVVNCALYEGANNRSGNMASTVIGSGSEVLLSFAITEANAANITAYNDLRIRFWGTSSTGSTGNLEIDQIYMEVPDTAGPATVDFACVIAGSGAVSPTMARQRAVAATLAGQGALTAQVAPTRAVAAAVAGQGALTVGLGRILPLAATVAGQGSLTVAVEKIVPFASTIAGAGALTAQINATRPVAVTVQGQGAVSVSDLARLRAIAATVAGQGTVAAQADALRTLAAAVAGLGAVTAQVAPVRGLGATVSGQGTLAAQADRLREIAAVVAGGGAVVVDIDVTGPVGGVVTFNISVAGQGAVSVATANTVRLMSWVKNGPRSVEWWLLDTIDAVGTATITFRGQTTVPFTVPHNDSEVQAALDGLSNVEPGDLEVFGGASIRASETGQYAWMDLGEEDMVLNPGGWTGFANIATIQDGSGGARVGVGMARTRALAASVAGQGALAAQVTAIRALVASLSGLGTVTAAIAPTRSLAATVAGQGAITVDITVQPPGGGFIQFAVDIAGSGQVIGQTVRTRAMAVNIRRRNMLDDGGFELGLNMWTTASVTPTVITSPTMHGKYAARVTRIDNNIFPRIYQFASLVPTGGAQEDLTYVGSVYIYGEAANVGKQLRLTVSEHGGDLPSAGTDYIHTISLGWQRISVERTITEPDRVGIWLYVLMHGSWSIGESFIMDSGQLEWISSAGQGPSEYIDTRNGPTNAGGVITADTVRTRNLEAPVGPNLWLNSSLEEGLVNVFPVGTPTPSLTLDTVNKKHGAQSLKVVAADGFSGFSWTQRGLFVGPSNRYYAFSWWMRCLEEQQQEIEWRFWNNTPTYLGGASLSNYHFGTLFDPQGWERYTTSFEVPAGTTWFELILDSRIAGDDFGTLPVTFWIDAAMLTVGGVHGDYYPHPNPVTADMSRIAGLAVTVAGQAAAVVAMARLKSVAINVAGQGTVSANIARVQALQAVIAGAGQIAVAARRTRAMAVAVAGQGTLGVNLGAIKTLSALIQGQATITAHLLRGFMTTAEVDEITLLGTVVDELILAVAAACDDVSLLGQDCDDVALPSTVRDTLSLVGAAKDLE